MFVLALQLTVVAVIIGFVFFGKKKIKADHRREEIRRLVRLAKSEAAIDESEQQRITDVACSVCYYAPTTARCSRCKVTRYCSKKCQIIDWIQRHRDECVEAKGKHCQQAETNYEEDGPRTGKQPSVPDAITNNSSNSFSFTLEGFLRSASDDDSKEENTNASPLIERSEDATKKALEQSKKSERFLARELAKSWKEISLLKSERKNWSARTSFVSSRLNNLMIESDPNQASEEARVAEGIIQEENIQLLKRELEQERTRRLQLEQDDGLQIAKIKVERLRQELAKTQKSVEYAESGWVKALRELEKERELGRLQKMECEEIRQSSMRQVEKKEQELANALNATAAAESKWVKALRKLEKKRELVRSLKMECEEIRQSSMRQVEKKEQELAYALNATAAAEANLFDLERAINSLDDKACAICLTNEKDVAFGCGHMACEDCMLTISNCHICRKPITSRLRLFPG